MTAMAWTAEQLLMDHDTKNKKITQKEYLEWASGFIFEGLRDQRYGQSFCNRFKINDNILFFAGNYQDADRYIQENYVETDNDL